MRATARFFYGQSVALQRLGKCWMLADRRTAKKTRTAARRLSTAPGDFPNAAGNFRRRDDRYVIATPAIVGAYGFLPALKRSPTSRRAVTDICSRKILKADPDLNAILFDLPSVIAGADDLLRRRKASAKKVRRVAGDSPPRDSRHRRLRQ